MQNEISERYINIVKRSIGIGNLEGGSNKNEEIVITTQTNIIQYSEPGSDITNEVHVKPITTTTPAVGNNSASQNGILGVDLENTEPGSVNVNVERSVQNQINDINGTETSGAKNVNKANNSTAISKSAITSSRNTGAILSEQSLTASHNQTRNEATDDLVTPAAVTRESVPVGTSSNNVANMIGGNNLNTTPKEQTSKINNEIPRDTSKTSGMSPTQTTSNSESKDILTTRSTTPTHSEITTENLLDVTTTAQTKPESKSNVSEISPNQNSDGYQTDNSTNAGSELAGKSDSDITSTENTESTNKTETTPKATVVPIPVEEEDTQGENKQMTNVTVPMSEDSSQPEPTPKTSTNSGESEPELKDNSTDDPVKMSTKTDLEHVFNKTTGAAEATNSTVKSVVNSTAQPDNDKTTKSQDNVTKVVSHVTSILVTENVNENKTSNNPSVQPSTSVSDTNSVTQNPVSNVGHGNNESSTQTSTVIKNSTGTEPTSVTEKTTETTATQMITVIANTTTSTVEQKEPTSVKPENNVTAEPEVDTSDVHPEPENTTKATTLSTDSTSSVTTQKTVPTPEPTTKSITTANPEPEEDTSKTTRVVHKTTELSSEPETYTSSKQTEIDTTTKFITEPTMEPVDESDETNTEQEKDYTDPEPEEEPEPEPEIKDEEAFAEPGPDWELAKSMWKEAWEFHVYFFGTAFGVLGLYCFVMLLRLWNMEHLLSKHYFITLHLLVITVCALRAVYLLVDAYNSLGTFPFGVDYFLYSTAFPCLTALFSILFYALLLATRVRVISKKVQKLWVLILIILLHFILSIVTDIIVGLYTSASLMIFICQAFFILWGLLMFVGYLVLFRKLYKGAINRKKNAIGHHDHKNAVSHPYHVKPSKHKYTLGLAVKITFMSAFFGVAIVGFELYGMFGVYGVLKSNTKPDPWPWWTYHTIVRSLEVLMCLSVAYVASQPLRYRMKKIPDYKIYHYLLPCSMCCCPNKLDHNETYSSSVSLDYVVSETDHLSWLQKLKAKKTSSPKAPYPPHTAEKYSDPDATLLVRKVKRTSKPSMLVVEDGFVRIRREDETLPSNQYELDSRSSHSSDANTGPDNQNTSETRHVNLNYLDETAQNAMAGIDFEKYILQGNVVNNEYTNEGSADETDIDIVVTESEQEDENGEGSRTSNKSAEIFRPLSMIDLAASMESELDRAFHSSCVGETDLISHKSLPVSFDGFNTDSNDCAYNEHLCEKFNDNRLSNLDNTNYSSDSADELSKSSATHLLHSKPLVRRCKSDDTRSVSPKYKHFERNKYFSVSGVDNIGKDDEVNTHLGSNGELRTEL